MQTFWSNIQKFPRFIIGVIIGFFLTTFYPIFQLLNTKKQNLLIYTFFLLVFYCIYIILKLMLDIK